MESCKPSANGAVFKGLDSILVKLMSRNAKQANALKRDPGPSLLAKTMDVLYGTSSFGGNGSRARARKRVTLLLSSWIFESKMSIYVSTYIRKSK